MNVRALFFEELAENLDYWAQASTNALLKDDAALGWTEAPEEFRAMRCIATIAREC